MTCAWFRKQVVQCRHLGCNDTTCALCAQNPQRRCQGNFASKYLAGDVLKAKCGASIRVEIIDDLSGEAAPKEQVKDIFLEV